MEANQSVVPFYKVCLKALVLGGLVIAIGYPLVGEPAEWLGLIVFAGFMTE